MAAAGMKPISKLVMTGTKTTSLQNRIQTSYIIIISLMLVAPVISLASSWYHTLKYDQMIANVSKTNRLNQIVRSDISNELWDIVAGNKDFDEGRQYGIIRDINSRLDNIKFSTEQQDNRQLLEVAGRAMDTLSRYVDQLGFQMEQQYPVTANEKTLDEIRGVADLVSDILQDFIVLEIESVARTNEQIKNTAAALSLVQIFVVAAVMLFAVLAHHKG